MNFAQLAGYCNNLSVWKRRVTVWGYHVTASNGDRLLNLCLHKAGLMGAEQREVYSKLLSPGMTVVDIGANQGLYALLFSRLVGPEGKVFSFEPDAALFAALESNVKQNRVGNITLFNTAVGATTETRTLYHSRVNSGDNRLAPSDRPDWFYQVPVKTATLDSIMGNLKVDFIKIDVQGWEGEVLKGMWAVCANNPSVSIYFEFWPFGLRRAGCEPMDLLRELEQRGFSLHLMAPTGPANIADPAAFCEGIQGYKSTNVLATRKPF